MKIDFTDPDDILYFARQISFWPEETKQHHPASVYQLDHLQLVLHQFVKGYYHSDLVSEEWESLYKTIPIRFIEEQSEPFPTPLLVYILYNFTPQQMLTMFTAPAIS